MQSPAAGRDKLSALAWRFFAAAIPSPSPDRPRNRGGISPAKTWRSALLPSGGQPPPLRRRPVRLRCPLRRRLPARTVPRALSFPSPLQAPPCHMAGERLYGLVHDRQAARLTTSRVRRDRLSGRSTAPCHGRQSGQRASPWPGRTSAPLSKAVCTSARTTDRASHKPSIVRRSAGLRAVSASPSLQRLETRLKRSASRLVFETRL